MLHAVRGILLEVRKGEVIGGRYELIGLLDRGGQGSVYRARDLVDQEEVAVKVLADARDNQPEWRERMFREARALASLTGTAAVRVYDQRWTEAGELCLITELLKGADFEDFLKGMEQRGERLSVERLIAIIAPIVHTLEIAHERGILHRDLKPANIFVLHTGGVRLLDFGFAKFIRERRFTGEGFVAGSPSYIAPEMWKDAKHLDHRIDVYSLATVLFRALAGRPPFTHKDVVEILRMATNAARPSLHALRPDLPPAVDDWVEQALAIDREHRFFKVRAMWNAFLSAVGRG
jgi:eukaryotic-like serine/threonine-protein kinase